MELTEQHQIVLERMNQGQYLVKAEKGEYMSTDGRQANSIVKSGTADFLVEQGYIYKSHALTPQPIERYLLTNDGRKFKKIEK